MWKIMDFWAPTLPLSECKSSGCKILKPQSGQPLLVFPTTKLLGSIQFDIQSAPPHSSVDPLAPHWLPGHKFQLNWQRCQPPYLRRSPTIPTLETPSNHSGFQPNFCLKSSSTQFQPRLCKPIT